MAPGKSFKQHKEQNKGKKDDRKKVMTILFLCSVIYSDVIKCLLFYYVAGMSQYERRPSNY